MSSWVRDMAMKPPQKVEAMPVLESPTLMISEPGPVRTFDLPITRRSQLLQQQQEQQQQLNKRAWYTVGSPGEIQEKPVMRTFENTSRLRFDKAVRQTQRPAPQAQPEPVVKKPVLPEAPPVSQIARPENPVVTVVLETNKDIEFLDASLQSISRQTFSSWVGILVLRSQNDEVAKTVRQTLIKLQLNQIFSVMEMDEKMEPSEALQVAIGAATTKYIAFATNTDLWTAKKLEQQVAELEGNLEIGIVGSMSRYFGDRVELAKIPPGSLTEDDFKSSNPVVFPSVVMRRELASFTNEFKNYEFESWVRSIVNGVNITNLSSILTLQRVNSAKQLIRKEDKDDIRSKYNLI